MIHPYELSAAAAVRALRSGQLSAAELLTSLLNRIEALDSRLQAWETLERRDVLTASARAIDAARIQARAGHSNALEIRGLLFGVKDIFLTRGLRTSAGFSPWRDRIPDTDAAVVSGLRRRGGIVLGKTVTTQFAFTDPARTVNPWKADRTPGGSSSGSAAAVAARMVPLALGTQTAGSVLRPAAYCGVIGFKPSFGRLSTAGVIPLAWSLDHVGILCREVADVALALDEPEPTPPARAPVFGLVTDVLDAAQPEVREHTLAQASRFERHGARVIEVRLPLGLSTVLAIHHVTMQAEIAAVHSAQLDGYPNDYAPLLRRAIEVGRLLPAYVYQHAQRLRARFRQQIATLFDDRQVDALLTPTAANIAPGRETTGDARFQAIWTLIGLPAISLPSGLNEEGLPFGLQLAGRLHADGALLSVAAWCQQVLGPMPAPHSLSS